VVGIFDIYTDIHMVIKFYHVCISVDCQIQKLTGSRDQMVYLVFDLDGTLGDVIALYKIMCYLRQDSFYARFPGRALAMPENLGWQLSIAYGAFVKRLAASESSADSIGIFRPGIFEVFREIVKMKKSGVCRGAILYTNNGSLPLVECVRDVIHMALNYPVFNDIYYYYHPLRLRRNPVPQPGKTWAEMKMLLVDGLGAPATVGGDEVLFFDDQNHVNLMLPVAGGGIGPGYIKVWEYKAKPNVAKLIQLYRESLAEADMFSPNYEREFLAHCTGCPPLVAGVAVDSIEKHLELLAVNILPVAQPVAPWMRGPPQVVPMGPDNSVQIILNALHHVPSRKSSRSSTRKFALAKSPYSKPLKRRRKSRRSSKK